MASKATVMSPEAKDTKKVAMELNGQDMADSDNALPWKIEAYGDIALNMQTKLPAQSASSKTKIATSLRKE